jgi:hypothetical protein
MNTCIHIQSLRFTPHMPTGGGTLELRMSQEHYRAEDQTRKGKEKEEAQGTKVTLAINTIF